MRAKLQKLQQAINDIYAEEGLSDEVLELQVALNKLRNKHNISDETNRIYEEFVQ